MNEPPSLLLVLCVSFVVVLVLLVLLDVLNRIEGHTPKTGYMQRLRYKIKTYGPSELECAHGTYLKSCPLCIKLIVKCDPQVTCDSDLPYGEETT